MTGGILHRMDGAVSWITIDRPDVRNAIAPEHRDRLIGLLYEASASRDVRAVVLTGSGDAFCSGADLRGSSNPPERVAGDVARLIRVGAQRLVAAVLDCEKPVVAAVNGVAAGIGAHLAFACDLVIAAEDARFIEVFVRRGLVPDGGGAWLLPRLIGLHRAKELGFFGDALPAPEAQRLGLVNAVVERDDVGKVSMEWAARLASGPTRAIALTKRLANRSFDSDRETSFEEEAWAQEVNMSTRDAQEGVRAFVERREPAFEGW